MYKVELLTKNKITGKKYKMCFNVIAGKTASDAFEYIRKDYDLSGMEIIEASSQKIKNITQKAYFLCSSEIK